MNPAITKFASGVMLATILTPGVVHVVEGTVGDEGLHVRPKYSWTLPVVAEPYHIHVSGSTENGPPLSSLVSYGVYTTVSTGIYPRING